MRTWQFTFCAECHRAKVKQVPELSKKRQLIAEGMFQDALTLGNEGNTIHCQVWYVPYTEALMLQQMGTIGHIIRHTTAKT